MNWRNSNIFIAYIKGNEIDNQPVESGFVYAKGSSDELSGKF
jgi:hypothetical protein